MHSRQKVKQQRQQDDYSNDSQEEDGYGSEDQASGSPSPVKGRGGPSQGQKSVPSLEDAMRRKMQNEKIKRKKFQKLGYNGVNKDEMVPDEIFQMLWLVQKGEDSLFMKSAKDYAEIRILDRPKRRLDAMIDLRQEINKLCDNFYSQCKIVTDRVLSETYDPNTDEGLLEIGMERYLETIHVDLQEMDNLLSQEVASKKEQLAQAERSAGSLVSSMQNMLQENESSLKGFLEDSKYQVDVLSKGEAQRNNVHKAEFKDRMLQLEGLSLIETNLKVKKEAAKEASRTGIDADLSSGQVDSVIAKMGAERQKVVGLMTEEDDGATSENDVDWEPRLRKTVAIGQECKDPSKQFQWPSLNDLNRMPLDKKIKLNGFCLKANTNLYQIKLTFTSKVQSKVVNTVEGASLDGKVTPISTEKTICAVELYMRPGESNIYGIRFMDYNNKRIQEKQWRRSNDADWVRIEIPDDHEIIGFHGSHDGNYIKQLGLVLWKPNPDATREAR